VANHPEVLFIARKTDQRVSGLADTPLSAMAKDMSAIVTFVEIGDLFSKVFLWQTSTCHKNTIRKLFTDLRAFTFWGGKFTRRLRREGGSKGKKRPRIKMHPQGE
jgi:hypothetical protein